MSKKDTLRPALRFGQTLLAVALLASASKAGTITPGTPGAAGTLTLQVTKPDGTKVDVMVNVPAGATAAQKATLIFNAMAAKGIPNLGYIGATTVTAGGSAIAQTGDTTAENTKIVLSGSSLQNSPAYASLGYDGPLTATGTDGLESMFTASFGEGNSTFASATVAYDALVSPTDANLATALFDGLLADLSPNLQSDLSLNVSTDTITFTFPAGQGDYWVDTSTNSAVTSPFMSVNGVTPAPEPITFVSVGAGLLLIGTLRRRSSTRSGAKSASSVRLRTAIARRVPGRAILRS